MGYKDRLYSKRILLILTFGLILFGTFSIVSVINFQSSKKILIQSLVEDQLPMAGKIISSDSFKSNAAGEINRILITNTLINSAVVIVFMVLVLLAAAFYHKKLEQRADRPIETDNEQKTNQKKLELAYAELDSFFTNSMIGVVIFKEGRIVSRVNQRMADILGYDSPDVFVGKSTRYFHLSDENYEEFGPIYYHAMTEKEVTHVEYQFRRKDGSSVWLSSSGKPLDRNCPPDLTKGIVGVFDDINERKENQKKLELAYAELDSFFTNSMIGVGMFRGGRFVDRVNQRLADILKYDSPDSFKGRSMEDFHLSKENYEEFGKKFYASLAHREVFQVEYPFKCKDGTHIWASVSGKAVDQNYPADLNRGIVWIFDDITDRRAAEQKLVEMATTDALTGLTNRRHFMELAERAFCMHKRNERPLSLLMLDIDYFKKINDTYGHGVGDKALVFFADICSRDLRSEDILGRLGGEEFAVLLSDTGTDQALEIAERIRQGLETTTSSETEDIPAMSVSIGVTAVGRGDDLERVLQSADTALYQAKISGRNCVKIFG